MEYNQFKQLLELKGIREKETISLLEDFIGKFPYSQTARLLYAKALHDQDNIHYDQHLKLAAAYAPNREILRDLVEMKTEEVEFEFPLSKKEEPVKEFVSSDNEEVFTAFPKEEMRFEESYTDDEISGRAFEEQREKEKMVDPHEVIRQRLSEILGEEIHKSEVKSQKSEPIASTVHIENLTRKKVDEEKIIAKEEKQEKPIYSGKTDIKEFPPEKKIEAEQIQHPIQNSDEERVIMDQAEKAIDVLDKMELEHAMEESILDSLEKLPSLTPFDRHRLAEGDGLTPNRSPRPNEDSSGRTKARGETAPTKLPVETVETDKSSARSFTQWLKTINNQSSAGFEEVRAPKSKTDFSIQPPIPENDEDPESLLSDDELIEKFLLEDPKIIPSRSEFYSPVSQAKKSVMDHDDTVSETLAQIYLRQGNTQKAKWCYEKLILLHPEKSAFFAALLKEIPEGSDEEKK